MSNPLLSTSLLLIASNVFMTFAWYGHLKNLAQSPMNQPLKLDYLYAAVCLMGAVYFIFRST